MRVREEDVKGPGTVLRSTRETALFSDLNFMTWNCKENGQTEWDAVQQSLHPRWADCDFIQLSESFSTEVFLRKDKNKKPLSVISFPPKCYSNMFPEPFKIS